mmetsp:Transcript_5041/g.7582  ORF Transcript_5041/g.7582 Transcript_5041/m.7582 type:complete len:120 (-) Transcript_5041:689-1048(-)
MLYTCGNFIKLLRLKEGISKVLFKNHYEITCMTVVQQNPNMIAFGSVTGAIKDFDMKTGKIVRTSSQRHKKAISCLASHGKYLISCSTEDNLVLVYDYAKQEEFKEITLGDSLESKKKI